MPNTLDTNGLTIKSTTEIVNDLVAALQLIYGSDINVLPNSPDGQLINIFAQADTDMLELLMDAYNSFSIQNAYGTLLDQRVAINGIARKQGTYTITNVTVTVSQALTLTGLDALVTNPSAQVFTVQDGSGNQFQLVTTYVFSGAGSTVLIFRAAQIGAVQATVNTITNQTTTVLGVTTVNNPTIPTSTGVDEETDAQLKLRHAASFALAATGPADSVQAALLAIPGITDALVIENATAATVNTVPANSIWVIVTGGTAAQIAGAIYAKKGLGCGMKGAQSYTVTRPSGNGFVALWDTSVAMPLYITLSLQPRIAGSSYDATFIKASLAAALIYKLGQSPTIGDIVNAMLTIAPNFYLVSLGVSTDGITYYQVVTPTSSKYYFTLVVANIVLT